MDMVCEGNPGDCKNGTFFLLYAESDEFLLEAASSVQHAGQIWEAWNLGKVAASSWHFSFVKVSPTHLHQFISIPYHYHIIHFLADSRI